MTAPTSSLLHRWQEVISALATAATIGDRRLALFLHKPVFVSTQDDPTLDVWSVPPSSRPGLAPMLGHPALRLVASGL